MARIPSVKITQPHIEQLHMHLDYALEQTWRAKKVATKAAFVELLPLIEEIAYEIKTARQYVPPKQPRLPF